MTLNCYVRNPKTGDLCDVNYELEQLPLREDATPMTFKIGNSIISMVELDHKIHFWYRVTRVDLLTAENPIQVQFLDPAGTYLDLTINTVLCLPLEALEVNDFFITHDQDYNEGDNAVVDENGDKAIVGAEYSTIIDNTMVYGKYLGTFFMSAYDTDVKALQYVSQFFINGKFIKPLEPKYRKRVDDDDPIYDWKKYHKLQITNNVPDDFYINNNNTGYHFLKKDNIILLDQSLNTLKREKERFAYAGHHTRRRKSCRCK